MGSMETNLIAPFFIKIWSDSENVRIEKNFWTPFKVCANEMKI